MLPKPCPWWLLLPAITSAANVITTQEPTRTLQHRAIIPTGPGEIGINPVEEDIGDAATFAPTIAPTDSVYIEDYHAQTVWKVPDANYLTVTTSEGTTSTIQVAVATATADADGQSVGDIGVILPAALAKALQDTAVEAVNACNVLSLKKIKRSTSLAERSLIHRDAGDDALSCLLSAAQKHASDGGLFDVVDPAIWETFTAELAAAAPQLMRNAFQVAVNQAVRNKMVLFMAAVAIAVRIAENGGNPNDNPVAKYNIPKTGLGTPFKDGGSQTDNNKCPPGKGVDSPICPLPNCLGEPGGVCTIGEFQGCECLLVMKPRPQEYDPAWFDKQQEILQAVSKPNEQGTGITVNKGCIYINDSLRCQGSEKYNVADQGTDESKALIYAQLPSDSTSKETTPGCVVEFHWPRNYGDVYYGEDNCLYDSAGTQIDGQCCTTPPTDGKTFPNPYYQESAPQDPAPPAVPEPLVPTDNTGANPDCVDRSDGSGVQIRTQWTAGSSIVMGQRLDNDIDISTESPDACVKHGQTKNKDGAILSNWCVVAQMNGIAFVIADKYQDWGNGAIGWSTIKGSNMIAFSNWSANNCQGENKATVIMGGSRGSVGGASLNSLCIVNADHPEVCVS